jgi:hypothetical protein
VLLTKYYVGDQMKTDEMGRACGTYGTEEKCIRSLMGVPEGKMQLGRPRLRWGNNVRTELKEIVWKGVDWFI